MDHFTGVVPEQRWKNDVLTELRENNRLLRQLLEHNAQVVEQVEKEEPKKRTYTRRKGVAS